MSVDIFYKKIGQEIKSIRKNNKMTQEQLAKKVGLTKSAIVNYETGNRKIPVDILVKLSEYYHFSIDCVVKKPKKLSDLLNDKLSDRKLTDQQEQLLVNYIELLLGSEK